MISALVVTVDARAQDAVVAHLVADPRFTVGEPQKGRVPVVLEAAGGEASEEAVRQLSATDGVQFVDVVLVDSQDEEP